MSCVTELMAIERQLWTNDAQVYEATYLPEAVLIFPAIGRISQAAAVEAIRQENASGRAWAEVRIEDASVIAVDPQLCLLSYHAEARWNDAILAEEVDCLTVYIRRDGRWPRFIRHPGVGIRLEATFRLALA